MWIANTFGTRLYFEMDICIEKFEQVLIWPIMGTELTKYRSDQVPIWLKIQVPKWPGASLTCYP